MNISILVTYSPYGHAQARSAVTYAQQILADGHKLLQVFFYHEGVYHSLNNQAPSQGMPNILHHWLELDTDADMICCIDSAQSRGLHAENSNQNLLHPRFTIGSMAQLAQACSQSDHCEQF